MELPKKKIKPKQLSPNSMLIFGPQKIGKTTLVSELEGCLILDFEEGTNSIEALKINIPTFEVLREVIVELKAQGKPYKYLAVDTVSKLERMCEPLALKLYQKTPMGKKYEGHILDLERGGGYLYLRRAILGVLQEIASCTDGTLILIGHLRNSIINKEGEEWVSREVDLTGKISSIICGEVDAIAYIYRDGNKVMFNFENSDEIACGSRQEHLKGKKIIMSEINEDGSVTYHWNKIFID